MAFTDFYCDATNGSNLYSGSSTNTTPYTKTAGNWVNSTRVYTVQDGTNPSSSVNVGDFASIYADGASAPTAFIGRVTAVQNATNGTITISSTASAGTNPANGTANRTIVVGGPWKGPNSASGFPITLANGGANTLSAAVNAGGDIVRVNFKNNATYSITAVINGTGQQQMLLLQGYSSTVGDGGRATIDGGGNNINLATLGVGQNIADFIFSNVGVTTGSGTGLSLGSGAIASHVTVHDVRGAGLQLGQYSLVSECEVYAFDKGNAAGSPGINIPSGPSTVSRCYIHDAAGSNVDGILTTAGTASSTIIGNIFAGLGRYGIQVNSASSGSIVSSFITGNSFYNNGGAAIKVSTAAGLYYLYIENNIFTRNVYAVDGGANFTRLAGLMFNNVYGAGTEANSSGDYHTTGNLILDDGTGTNSRVVLASNLSPYVAAGTGNFSLNEPTAQGIGRGAFTESDGTNSGTVGYPDAGAAQAQVTAGGGGKSSHVFCG